MTTYDARIILHMDLESVWLLPDEPKVTVVFEDGSVDISTKELIFSYYHWEVQRKYELAPLKTTHALTTRIHPTAHVDLLSHISFDCYDVYKAANVPLDMEDICRICFRVTNTLFNDLMDRLDEYPGSSCALDFVEIMLHPEVVEANRIVQTKERITKNDLEDCEKVLIKVLTKDPTLSRNGICKPVRSKVVKLNQALQCIGPRGFVTDINSRIFPEAIRVGFCTGVSLIIDAEMESRTASQSLLFTKGPMQDSEYFNRSEQLAASSLSYIDDFDCGSTDYVPVTVSSMALFLDIQGAFYYDEDLKKEVAVTRKSTKILNKTILKRSVLTCRNKNPYNVCSKCFGELSISIPAGTNIGYTAAAQLQGPVGQLILSNKHYTGSAGVDEIVINELDDEYISLGDDENSIYINRRLKGREYYITIDEKQAANLVDINSINAVEDLSPYRISALKAAMFSVVSKDKTTSMVVDLSSSTRVGSLSSSMLKYVKQKGWSINDRGDYIIDMSDWDVTKPFIKMPLKHFSTVDFMKSIESFIKGGGGRGVDSVTTYETTFGALIALHDLVSLRLSVNLVYLEVILLSTLVVSRDRRDFRLPVDRKNAETARYNQLMALHSLSAAMAYEGQADVMFTPQAFLFTERPRHPLDFLVMGC